MWNWVLLKYKIIRIVNQREGSNWGYLKLRFWANLSNTVDSLIDPFIFIALIERFSPNLCC